MTRTRNGSSSRTALTRLLVERSGTVAQCRAVLAVSTGVLILVNVGEYTTPDELRIIMLAGFVPVLGALVLSVRQTALLAGMAALSVALAFTLRTGDENNLDEGYVSFVVISAMGLCSMVIARLGAVRSDRLVRTRTIAEAVQLALLRPLPLRTAGKEVHGVYIAADELARVGGDLYEVLDTAFGTRVLVADVRGNGLPAINAGLAVLSAFRVLGHDEPELPLLAGRMEDALDRYNAYACGTGLEDRHITALLVEFGPGGRTAFVNCGHLEPYGIGPAGVRRIPLGEAGLPLGFGGLVGDPTRPVAHATVADGEALVLYTDGVTEARDGRGEFYPLEERLFRWTDLTPRELVEAIARDLTAYAGGRLGDDAAILVAAGRGEPPGAHVLRARPCG